MRGAGRYICLGIILGVGLSWGLFSCTANMNKDKHMQTSVPTLAVPTELQAPFAVIYDFYQAINKGKNEQLASLVTANFLKYLNSHQNVHEWYQQQYADSSLKFVLFLVTDKKLDLKSGYAQARGRAEWLSPDGGIISFPQTVTIIKHQGTWKISAIKEDN